MSVSQSAEPRVLVAGNPNAGKSTLFNVLTGGRAHIGNYPGVTVETEVGRWRVDPERHVEVVDVPGTYSLTARSPEEQIAVRALLDDTASLVVCVVDATSLQRGLYLPLQLVEAGVPVVIAINMIDVVERSGSHIDTAAIARRFGVPVVAISASQKKGLSDLASTVANALPSATAETKPSAGETSPRIEYGENLVRDVAGLSEVAARSADGFSEVGGPSSTSSSEIGVRSTANSSEVAPRSAKLSTRRARGLSLWGLLSLGEDELEGVPESFRRAVAQVRAQAQDSGRNLDLEIIAPRYKWVEETVAGAMAEPVRHRKWSNRIDAVLTHKVGGLLAFAAVMWLVFEALFRWSEPMIGAIEQGVVALQTIAATYLPLGPLRDLVIHGVLAGVGNVVVFAPQILLLFLFIGFLEDSGYLARVAFVIDRVMNGVGLHGKAFVPLLSGFACAVPAVMATRTIEHRRDRFVTMLALPLMSCSARLPVFLLVVATVFGSKTIGGIWSAGALALLVMYTLSVLFTLLAASVLRRTLFKGPRPALVLEMPPYRWPRPATLWLTAWRRLKSFLVDAGTIILAFTIILWTLLSYPRSDTLVTDYAARHAQIVQETPTSELGSAILALDAERATKQLPNSAGGRLGRAIEPLIEPLGFDWRIGVGIIGAFAAREVFVSTLGMVFGFGDTDEEDPSLRRALAEATWDDGRPLLTPLSGLSLMVFFLLACQCMSTIAAVRRESGSWKWPALMFVYMTTLAYVSAWAVFQIGSWLGFG